MAGTAARKWRSSIVMKRLSVLSAAALGLTMSASVAFADDITISVVGPMTG
ncbi:MAG: branched-chain amino acid ABC transporter substrate-binding protein, partial [Mesorhizobium sp.]